MLSLPFVRPLAATQLRIDFITAAKCLTACAGLGFYIPVIAQETVSFDPITIEAESVNRSLPWTTQTSRQTLEALQIQNWNDFGSRVEPGIRFNESNQSINVRGLDKNRVLTRIDGIRQNWLNDVARGVRGGLSTVDFNTLSTIDITRGADSSWAGSGAMAGVIDIRTLQPDDLLGHERSFGSLLKGGYRSADRSWLTSAAIATRLLPHTQLLLQAAVQNGHEQGNMGNNDSYGLSRTVPDPDRYLQQNYQIKISQKFEDNHSLGFSGSFFSRQDDIQNLSASSLIYRKKSGTSDNTTLRESVSLDYAWNASHHNALLDSVDAQIYWQRVKLSNKFYAERLITPLGDYSRNNLLSDTTYGINSSISKAFSGSASQLWKAGVDWYGNQTDQSSSGEDNCPVRFGPYSPCRFLRTNQADMPQVRGFLTGLWIENQIGLADIFRLTPGVRYDYYLQQPQASESFKNNKTATFGPLGLPRASSGSAVSPKLLLEWIPTVNSRFFAQYAFGFNAPTPTQLYSRFGSPGTYLIEGNPDLQPETSRGWEFGTRLGDEKLNASLTYFDNNYQNFIEAVNGPGTALYPYYVQTFENLDQVRIYGIEAKASWKFSRGWHTFGSLAWSVGKNVNTKEPLNSIPPLTVIAGLKYSQEQWGAQGQLTVTAARNDIAQPDPISRSAYSDFKAPGYGVVDFTAYWTPQHINGLKLQAGVYNVFNQTYWNALNVPTAGPGGSARDTALFTSPGRNVQLTLTYQY